MYRFYMIAALEYRVASASSMLGMLCAVFAGSVLVYVDSPVLLETVEAKALFDAASAVCHLATSVFEYILKTVTFGVSTAYLTLQ